jgi:hypothetical protein
MDTKMRLATSIVIILDVAKELGIIRAQGQYLKKEKALSDQWMKNKIIAL